MRRGPARRPPGVGVGALMAFAAVTFAIASFVHSGATVPLGPVTVRDPFQGAMVPEAVIAVLVAVGAVSILARLRASRPVAVVACVVAILGTCYGLTVTVPRGQVGDITYHVGILALLLFIGALLVGPRRAAPRP
ncbi:MAG TPA: hypothetical protein VF053_04355 [Streptosporangiales bacterium]